MQITSTEVVVEKDETVLGATTYIVAEAGTFRFLQFVLCKRQDETGEVATCAFLGATIAGLDPNEVSE